MNAVEIEEAVSELATQPFDAAEFPFAFLRAFGRKDVELQRLRKGNASDVPGGVLRRDSVHMATCPPGGTGAALVALRESPKTAANRVKFIVATDGVDVQAEETATGEVAAFPLTELGRHFGFFLPLAGISAVKAIKDNPIDVKAVGRLNKLYVELLRENPDWAEEARRPELNRLMSRLVFCFFAEDTGIFRENLFTATVQQMSDGNATQTNTDEVLRQLFLAMATPTQHDGKPDGRHRQAAGVKPYADGFPFVNGGLFEDAGEVPRFSRAARNYLLRAGELNWREINPDIFGSMIQAVADDDERASLGMHYTSVPNILKVLNPLFLDELREKLADAGDSVRKLRALRRRIGRIRVFDPACGSGNFLVIAYRHMREIEHEIVQKTGDDPKSVMPLTNFYGIEIKGFAAEIARLALLIAEFQADSRLISQQAARSMVLPLHRSGQIREGNALRIDWLEVCPPASPVSEEWDLGGPTGRLALEDNGLGGAEDIETYICGNPPYKGSQDQTSKQKQDLEIAAKGRLKSTKSADYVAGWLLKGSDFVRLNRAACAFVTTNSVNQGRQVALYWPAILEDDLEIRFAEPSFPWRNLAAKNAAVTVSVVGLARKSSAEKRVTDHGLVSICRTIGPYLVPNVDVIVDSRATPISGLQSMEFGSMPNDDGGLIFSTEEQARLVQRAPNKAHLFRSFIGSRDSIHGSRRFCLWMDGLNLAEVDDLPDVQARLARVADHRKRSDRASTKALALTSHLFAERRHREKPAMRIARHSAENRPYLPVVIVPSDVIVADSAIALSGYRTYELSLYASKMHTAWVATVCGKIKTDYRYSNTLGWNTFPVPPLTDQDKADLTRCAEDILLAREAHFPATIADMYDPERMDRDFPDLRAAHERNDETLERIYIGRRFRNDTERLEHLFALYTRMTATDGAAAGKVKAPRAKRKTAA